MWDAWKLDAPTYAFLFWWAWFFAWETVALVNNSYPDTWTAHFRPVFVEVSFTWVLGQAVLFWLWVHFFYPSVERMVIDWVGRF